MSQTEAFPASVFTLRATLLFYSICTLNSANYFTSEAISGTPSCVELPEPSVALRQDAPTLPCASYVTVTKRVLQPASRQRKYIAVTDVLPIYRILVYFLPPMAQKSPRGPFPPHY